MCQRKEIRSLKRSDDTSGIGKREPVTRINVVSGRHNDKDRKKKTWPTRSSNGVVLPVLSQGFCIKKRTEKERIVTVNQDDLIKSLKHVQSFIHDSWTEEVSPRLIQQLREMTDLEAQFTLRELQQKPRFMQRKRSQNAFEVKANIQTPAGKAYNVLALLDSGCTGTTMDQQFAKEKGLETHKLPQPIPVYNADGSINQAGSITEFAIVELTIDDHKEQIAMGLSQLSTHTIFLGYDWLWKHNPIVNWQDHTLEFTCDNEHVPNLMTTDDNDEKEEERLFMINHSYLRNLSTKIVIQSGEAKRAQTFKEIIPEAYHEFKDMSDKETFDELPPRRPWDHAIELLPGDHKVNCKTYNLTNAEQKELDEFLEENLKTGCIRLSKSPFASAFFFIKKKDGKLQPVQDY